MYSFKVSYLISKYLGHFFPSKTFLLLILNLVPLFYKSLFCPVKFMNTCFMAQNMVCNCFMYTWFLLLLGEVFYKWQVKMVDSGVQVFYFFTHFCLPILSIIERWVLKSLIIIVNLSISLCSFISFYFMYCEFSIIRYINA